MGENSLSGIHENNREIKNFPLSAVYSLDKLWYTIRKHRKRVAEMVRKASKDDLETLAKVYRAAKAFMRASGNPTQWGEDYPECVLEDDLEKGQLYVVCGQDGEVHAAFVFALGADPTYQVIENGQWGNDIPYGTIHRLGSDGEQKGIFSEVLSFCKGIEPYIRADTHQDNKVMQHLLEKHGFVRRGTIYVGDGTPRIAYDLLP